MNAITVHYKYERPNTWEHKSTSAPLLINIDKIVSIEPYINYSGEDGAEIVTSAGKYIVRESYQEVINLIIESDHIE